MKPVHDSGNNRRNVSVATSMAHSMMLALEPRILFDGALVATAKDVLDDHQVALDLEMVREDFGGDVWEAGVPDWQPVLKQLATMGGSVMFIDTGVAGWQQLLAAVTPGTEVRLLDPERDGIREITEVLAGRGHLDAIHIVSHGRAGEVLLGSGRLSLETIAWQADVLGQWGAALAPEGDLLIHGCDVGAGERGQAFATAMAAATGADVALSTDATGAVHLGGDWELELRHGTIESPVPFVPALLASYQGLLEAPQALPGVHDHGITLDGVNDRVDLDDRTEGKYPLNRTQGTITLWFKIDENYSTATGKVGFIFANVLNGAGDLIHLHVESSGSQNWNLFGGLDGYNNTSIASARAGQWHHAALTWRTDGTGDIYLDGQRIKNYAAGISFSSTNAINTTVAIGTYADSGAVTFPGAVAEMRVWNTGLSTTAATALSWVRTDMTTASLTGGEAGLTGYYPLNDGVTNPADATATDTKSGIDAPLLPVGQPQWITRPAEGSAGVTVALGGSDADGDAIVKATLTSIPNATTQGSLYLPSDLTTPLGVNAQILTASDALRRVVFVPVTDFDGTVTWNFTVNDGSADSSAAAVSITMAPAQDAPVLTAAAPSLTAITENDTTNSGQTIASFAGSAITDVDTSPTPSEGIAITAVNSGYGTWQYDAGSGWQAVGAVSGTSALLLRDTDKIRYVPDGLHGENVGLTYRAWDRTSGTAGTKVDVSVNGGATAFSTATDTVSLAVTEVIDPPQLNIGTGDQVVYDGNNDYIRNTTFSFPTSAFTIEMWWKPATNLTSASTRQDLLYSGTATGRPHITFNKNGGGEIGIFTKIGGPSYDTAVTTTTSWTAGQWYHLAFTFDGGNTRVYVNGQLERQVAQPGVHDAQTGFYLGARSNLTYDMSGSLSDLRIWSTARSQGEIDDNMSRVLTGSEAGLSGYWPMNEGSGASVNDDAGSSDGTITAATWSSTDSAWGMEEEDIAIAGLSITDVDATGNETLTLSVTSGILTIDHCLFHRHRYGVACRHRSDRSTATQH
ncbi:MAG: DUF4347 domain-containing protein, partial [Magnetococcales bacterium]|nr:DUF4347 domain-containing protein [Magnetococcales bacterium]